MSSTAAAMGLVPVYHPSGMIRADAFTILPTYASAIFKGDPVILGSNGTVTVGTAAAALMGVFAGCEYIDGTGKPTVSNYYPAAQSVQSGSVITAWVYTDPQIVYECQSEGLLSATYATAIAYIGDECDINYVAGSTSTGISACSLDTSAMAAAGNQKQFRIVGAGLAPDNAITDAYPVLRVTMANTQLRAPTTAV